MEMLEMNIKDIINQYPAAGAILTQYNIGCVACSLGSCKLKDIVAIHNLPADVELALFTKIAGLLYPGQKMEISLPKRAPAPRTGKKLCPPIRDMVEEHTQIMNVIRAIGPLMARKAKDDIWKNDVLSALDFIRNFADKYHHAKEEDILFKYFEQDSAVIKSMNRDHEQGRAYIRTAQKAIEEGDYTAAGTELTSYGALLTGHIEKEDNILYPWMNRELSDNQVGLLFAACSGVDNSFGDKPAYYRKLADKLSKKYR